MLNKRIDTRTFVSKQYILEQLFIITYLVGLIFMHSMKSMVLFITVSFFIITFIYLLYKYKRFSNLDRWKKVDAKVISAKAIRCICFTAYNALEQQRIRKESYKPEILYRYIYKGEERTSDQYAISLDDADCNFSYTEAEAKKIANDFRRNKEIKIYVDQNTGESVINLNIAKGYGIPYVGLSIISLMILFLAYKVYTY